MNPAKQFDAGNGGCRGSEPLEAEHWTDAQLDASVVLSIRLFRYFDERSFVSPGAQAKSTVFPARLTEVAPENWTGS